MRASRVMLRQLQGGSEMLWVRKHLTDWKKTLDLGQRALVYHTGTTFATLIVSPCSGSLASFLEHRSMVLS